MAKRKPQYKASVVLSVVLEVPVEGATLEEAVVSARKLTTQGVLAYHRPLVDNAPIQIASVNADHVWCN